MDYATSKCAAWWFKSRCHPVDSSHISSVVTSICILFAIDYDAAMQQSIADMPKEGREIAWRKKIVDIDANF